jgi:hypothetical protein
VASFLKKKCLPQGEQRRQRIKMIKSRATISADVLSGSLSVSLSSFFDPDSDTDSDPEIERFEIGSTNMEFPN